MKKGKAKNFPSRASSLSEKKADKRERTESTATATTTAHAIKEDDSNLLATYDANLMDSDDSSDEEVLIRTGNVPRKWYELYDHQGYDIKGTKVAKMAE